MSTDPLPDQIGPYRIKEVLGEGGTGVVYLAEQTEPIHRRVALKILRLEADSPEVMARFEAERQTLAMMDHSSIAKVFDAGTTEDGRSYFAMELVSGEHLIDFCDRRRYPVRARIRLFADVCRAVQHAHQKGVIHRDLKPSNILVSDEEGRAIPRVIDFGVAKAVGSGEFDGAGLTREEQLVGTPAYMSPEQLDGSGDIDTGSDLYSLGVVLYELLVGALPYEPKAYRGWSALVAQMTREPPTPSARLRSLSDMQETVAKQRSTTPKSLGQQLRGDLGWIVSRAMEKDRAQRYETANGLALDLERYLAYQPVRARPATVGYSLRRFVRRNRLAAAFAGTAAIGVLAFAVAMVIQADRVARARDLAEARRDQAEGLIDFMLTDLREKLEPVGQLEILDDVGEQAMTYFASLPEDEFSDDELSSRARALHQIGQVRLQQGRLAEAEAPFRESLRLAQALSRRSPTDNERLFDLGQSQFWVGSLAYRRGDAEDALSYFERYRDTSVELVRRDSTNLAWQLERGYSHTNIGFILLERGDPRAALAEFEASLAAKERVARAEPENARRRYDVAQGHFNVGIARAESGDLRGARESFGADVGIKVALVADDPGDTRSRSRLVVSRGRLANIVGALGASAEAIDLRRRQWEDASWLIERDPRNATWQMDAAVARGALGRELVRSGFIADGLGHTSAAVRTLDEMVASDPGRAELPIRLATARRRHAEALLLAGRVPEALDIAGRGVEGLHRHLATSPQDRGAGLQLGMSLVTHAAAAAGAGDLGTAENAWTESLAVLSPLPTAGTEWRNLTARATALLRLGRPNAALPLVEALELMGVPFAERSKQ